MIRGINLSAALIVLICFFLPWEQVSCGGARDTLSGFDLARHDQTLLFIVPLLMLAVMVASALRRGSEKPGVTAVVSVVAGTISGFLMNRQRARVQDEAGLISAQLTGWFWLAFLATLGVLVTGIGMLINPRRKT
jgi:hypothetical protein